MPGKYTIPNLGSVTAGVNEDDIEAKVDILRHVEEEMDLVKITRNLIVAVAALACKVEVLEKERRG